MIHNTRVEAYDISNISGQHAVGSMVVFENGKSNKSQYRKFKIKTVDGSNDVAMMKEVLLRRFKNDWAMPDLVLLDGGVGHANAIGELVQELGLDLLIVAVAKGVTRKNLNFQFPISNKVSMSQFPKELQDFLNDKNLVKSIMDEAHRFAITFHRKLRSKSALK
jgi:excinuclease ABC subunit C